MALSITHPFVSAKSEGGDTTKVRPSNWNAVHAVTGLGTGVETALGINVGTTGAFVVLGGSGSAAAPMTLAGGTVTANAPPLTITETWNNVAVTFEAFVMDITNTNSAAGSLLANFKVGGSSKFSVDKAGFSTALSLKVTGDTIDGGNSPNLFTSGGSVYLCNGPSGTVQLGHTTAVVMANSTFIVGLGASRMATLTTDAAGIWAMRDHYSPTDPQELRIYNTWTDASNKEFFNLKWETNMMVMRTEKAGSGSYRNMAIIAGGTELYIGASYYATWYFTADGFQTVGDNEKDIGQPTNRRPRDLHIGRNIQAAGFIYAGNTTSKGIHLDGGANASIYFLTAAGPNYSSRLMGDSTGSGGPSRWQLGSTGTLEWGSTAYINSSTFDTTLQRDNAAGIIAIRTGTGTGLSNGIRTYLDYTDASNNSFIWLGYDPGTGDVGMGSKKLGSVSAQSFVLRSAQDILFGPAAGRNIFMAGTMGNYTDNTYDWGINADADTNYRPRDVYIGRAIILAGHKVYATVPQVSVSADRTLALTDNGQHIYHPSADTTARAWTIPANSSVAFPVGASVTFVNDTSAGVITIPITTDTLVFAGSGATGTRTLAAGGMATILKTATTRWMISGSGLT